MNLRQHVAAEVEPRDLSAALIGSLTMILIAAAAVTWRPTPANTAKAAPLDRIDPNAAPWYELTALPDIGESAARAIVEFRERIRSERGEGEAIVFSRAANLDAVRGIGPVTIGRIAPYLSFPAPPLASRVEASDAARNTRSRSSGERR